MTALRYDEYLFSKRLTTDLEEKSNKAIGLIEDVLQMLYANKLITNDDRLELQTQTIRKVVRGKEKILYPHRKNIEEWEGYRYQHLKLVRG